MLVGIISNQKLMMFYLNHLIINLFILNHSYYLDCPDKMISSYFNYFNQFPSSINYKNIFGFQFHPEKSSKNGEDLFKHFLKIIF